MRRPAWNPRDGRGAMCTDRAQVSGAQAFFERLRSASCPTGKGWYLESLGPTRGARDRWFREAEGHPGRLCEGDRIGMDQAQKAKLGERWVCFSCSAKFYDLNKPEPLCPKCGANQTENPATKPRRKKASRKKAAARKSAPPPEIVEEEEEEADIDMGDFDDEVDELGIDDLDMSDEEDVEGSLELADD